MQFSLNINFKIFAKKRPSQRDQISVKMLPSQHKTDPQCSNSPLPTVHFSSPNPLHFLTLYLASSPPLPEGREGMPWEPSQPYTLDSTPPLLITITVILLTATGRSCGSVGESTASNPEAQVRSPSTPCQICGGQSDSRTVLSASASVSLSV